MTGKNYLDAIDEKKRAKNAPSEPSAQAATPADFSTTRKKVPSVALTARISLEVDEALDAWCQRNGKTRTAAIVQAIELLTRG